MDRRTVLKYAAATTGIGLSSAFIGGFLSCKPEITQADYRPQFYSQSEFKFITDLVDVIIPETDTPGAVELGVPQWLDTMVHKCYAKEDQELVKKRTSQVFNELGKEAFSRLTQNEKLVRINALELLDTEGANSLKSIRQEIGSAYLGTEYVGKNLLVYQMIPGEYEPCIPLSNTNGKAYTYG